MDIELERRVYESIYKYWSKLTLVNAAHRLDTLREYDQFIYEYAGRCGTCTNWWDACDSAGLMGTQYVPG